MTELIKPQATPAIVGKDGVMTLEMHLMLLSLYEKIRDLETRVEALEP